MILQGKKKEMRRKRKERKKGELRNEKKNQGEKKTPNLESSIKNFNLRFFC